MAIGRPVQPTAPLWRFWVISWLVGYPPQEHFASKVHGSISLLGCLPLFFVLLSVILNRER